MGLPFKEKKIRFCQRQEFGEAKADGVSHGKSLGLSSVGLSSVCLSILIPDHKNEVLCTERPLTLHSDTWNKGNLSSFINEFEWWVSV